MEHGRQWTPLVLVLGTAISLSSVALGPFWTSTLTSSCGDKKKRTQTTTTPTSTTTTTSGPADSSSSSTRSIAPNSLSHSPTPSSYHSYFDDAVPPAFTSLPFPLTLPFLNLQHAPPPPVAPHPAMSAHELPVVLHNDTRGLLTIEEDKLAVLQLSSDGRPPKTLLSCPTRLVLRARLTSAVENKPRRLELFTLGQKGNASSTNLHLRKIHVLVEPAHHAASDQWVEMLMKLAYPVTMPFRRVLLLVNPVGGKGKARSIVQEQVMPLLEAAGCKVDRIETTHTKHAEEITSSTDLSKYDVIATASGDGNVYEILNGLAKRPKGRRALRTPIAPIPTGSACAACTNLFGAKDTFNIALATLNIIKGQPFSVDLCSILLMPSGERRMSFLSTALGLMVDLDIGTEHLRWMGDSRFIYGFVRGVMARKPCKARVCIDVITDDKEEMAQVAREAASKEAGVGKKVMGRGTDPVALITGIQTAPPNLTPTTSPGSTVNGSDNDKNPHDELADDDDDELPPQKPLQPTDEWLTIESTGKKGSSKVVSAPPANPDQKHGNWKHGHNMFYFYAGLMPWVSRDLNQWPVVRAGSGVIDIVVQRIVPRAKLLNGIADAEHGDAFWEDSQHYYKARAFTVENLDKANQPMFTIDGEAFPWDSFHVEVLPRAATFLSLDGRFYHSRFVTSDKKPHQHQHKHKGIK